MPSPFRSPAPAMPRPNTPLATDTGLSMRWLGLIGPRQARLGERCARRADDGDGGPAERGEEASEGDRGVHVRVSS